MKEVELMSDEHDVRNESHIGMEVDLNTFVKKLMQVNYQGQQQNEAQGRHYRQIIVKLRSQLKHMTRLIEEILEASDDLDETLVNKAYYLLEITKQ